MHYPRPAGRSRLPRQLIAVFLIGILLIVLAIVLIAAPLITAALMAARTLQAPAGAPRAITMRSCRLIALITGTLGFLVFDVIWATHSLHWSHTPILAFLLIGAASAGALALLHDRVEPWVENPVRAAGE